MGALQAMGPVILKSFTDVRCTAGWSIAIVNCPVAVCCRCLFWQISFLCLFNCLPSRLIFFQIQVFSCRMPNCCAKFGSFL